MTGARRNRLQQALLALQTELSARGFERLAPNRTSAEAVGEDEDGQPLNEMNQSVSSGRNRNRAVMLAQVTAALVKLRDDPDDFGICEECSEAIPLPRLTAMPYAPLCVACQTKKDGPRSGPTRRKITDYR